MEKDTRRRLLDAAYESLTSRGASGATVRAVEERAGVPHGSVRHHFGSRDGLVAALVDDLVAADLARAPEDPLAMLARFLGPERDRTMARYELMLLAMRDPGLRDHLVRARDSLVALVERAGLPRAEARTLVAALDGLILDGLLRGDTGADPALLLRAVASGAASPAREA